MMVKLSVIIASKQTHWQVLETARTPPALSSSPGPTMDSIEMSPLPHKAPFVTQTPLDTMRTELSADMAGMDVEMQTHSPSELSRQAVLQQ